MNKFSYHVIRSARDGIDTLDAERRRLGMSQMGISAMADTPDVGQWYARMWGSGDVKMSKFLRFARAAGYEIVMVKKEELDGAADSDS